ncbi:fungal-specific transcription factor domain-containing protein [Fusarium solani]|uniref:Fungal-specific transcription factor domain-containing protein n=1 Tax=Fusarium solani TaxID=169388 RepID=A0A9P9JZ58_FUSSL|nr:fungal-specific transcription factor domain-containing protein [Fusarium solani]KAH7243072.1 fungal-specific transcription factor domain-containing protein [Fusarium solani]
MDDVAQSSRRKACDYCVSRKIKCDGRKPTCSNCTLYGVACKITTARRRAVLRSTTTIPSAVQPPQPDRMQALEERLAGIEALLSVLTGTKSSTSASVPAARYPDVSLDDIDISTPADGLATDASPTLFEPDQWPMPLTMHNHLELPPLSEILPVVDNYFKKYNRLMPLFDEPTFMRMLLDWHSSPNKRSMVPWAAVNIVMAINYRVLEGRYMDDPPLAQCVRNIRSVMTELMTPGQDLMGVQVLLAMAIFYQGSADFQLAIVLMGSVVRLAQSLRLHSRLASQRVPKAEALLRSRVFWIAYIYDRELALRCKSPYYQLDSETDLDLPPADPEDGLGVISSDTDSVQLNFLRARVQLAFIQGKTNDLLYSQKGRKLTHEQRSNNITRIEERMTEWLKTIPPELQTAEGIKQRLSQMSTLLMLNMFYRHFECLIQLHSIFSFDDVWIDRVNTYLSPAVIEVKNDEPDGELVRAGLAPLPPGWTGCVSGARLCLELIAMGRQSEFTLWLHTCGSYSCLVLLIVNMIEFPAHDHVSTDRRISDACLTLFDAMCQKLPKDPFAKLLGVVRELDRRARGQVNRLTRTKEGISLSEEMSPSLAWTILEDMEL